MSLGEVKNKRQKRNTHFENLSCVEMSVSFSITVQNGVN